LQLCSVSSVRHTGSDTTYIGARFKLKISLDGICVEQTLGKVRAFDVLVTGLNHETRNETGDREGNRNMIGDRANKNLLFLADYRMTYAQVLG
jgi:hypothetical protein